MAVPYGNLEAYTQHLAHEWGSDEEYVMIYISFGHRIDLPSADDLSKANETLLNTLTSEQRQKLKRLDDYHLEDMISEQELPPEYKEKLDRIPLEERRKVKFMKNPDGTISVTLVSVIISCHGRITNALVFRHFCADRQIIDIADPIFIPFAI